MLKQANAITHSDEGTKPNQEAFLPFEFLPGTLDAGLVLICDHASNALPAKYGTLGLPPEMLQRHIGYDIGAAKITRKLAKTLGVPAVLSCFSRLLIDPNRGLDDPTLVMRLSDGAIVPSNARIDGVEIAKRVSNYYQPYHRAIDQVLDDAIAAGRTPAILSIHSFTQIWKNQPRPWHITILHDKDIRLTTPLIAALEQEPGLVVGDNVPYSGELEGDCLYQHGTSRGLAHALIEIRQDLICTKEGRDEWVARLARILPELTDELKL